MIKMALIEISPPPDEPVSVVEAKLALPPNGTAWTCTAASMVQPAAPTTPVYAPLITATGMYGMSAGVMVA